MSKLILKGDTSANFGEYLPDPYIDQIILDTDSDGVTGIIGIEIHIFVKVTEEVDEFTYIENLKKLDFYWTLGFNYTPDDASEKFIFDYMQAYGTSGDSLPWSKYTLSTLVDDNGTNGFLKNSEGTDVGYEVFYDENGDRVLKFTYKGEISYCQEEGSGSDEVHCWSWPTYETYDNLYVYTFSTSEDLVEDYWTDIQTTKYSADPWVTLLKTEMSAISYEPVMHEGAKAVPEEVVWIDVNEAVYGNTPFQSIQGSYYKPDKLTHEQVVSSFQELVDEYQDAAATDAPLLDAVNNISYILITYGDEVDLLPQLNEYRKIFPSKTSSTLVGQLYGKFRKKIYSANEIIVLGERLYKRVVSGSKIVDLRYVEASDYTGPSIPDGLCSEEPNCGDCEIVNFTGAGAATNVLNRTVWPGSNSATYTDEEFEEMFEHGGTYGWFFFDYDKAFYYTSVVAAVLNVKKLIKTFGVSIFNLSYKLKSVNLSRTPFGGTEPVMNMNTPFIYVFGPHAGDTEYTCTGETDYASGPGCTDSYVYKYAQPYGEYVTDGTTNTETVIGTSFLLLRNFDIYADPSLAQRGAYGEADAGYVDAGAFRLMGFEFQDLMSYGAQSNEEGQYSYTATVTIEDTTAEIAQMILDAFQTTKTDFDDYYDTAKEACSYNNINMEFTQFFIDEMEADHGDNLNEAPWVKASTLYHYFIDIIGDIYQGDQAAIKEAATQTAYDIAPATGNIPQLENFYDSLTVLQDQLDEISVVLDDVDGTTVTREFACSLPDNGEGLGVSIYQDPLMVPWIHRNAGLVGSQENKMADPYAPTQPSTRTMSAGTSQTERSTPSRSGRTVVIDGKVYKRSSNSAQIQIALKQRNLKVSNSVSSNEAALMLLTEYDCGLSGETSTFTLTGDQAETIDNENIMDEDLYGSLKPEPISPDQSFTDVNDPFYQLDDELSDKYQVQEETEKASMMPSLGTVAVRIMSV